MHVLVHVWDGDIAYSFRRSSVTVLAAALALLWFFAAAFAPWIAPYDPADLKTLTLLDSLLPPVWLPEGKAQYVLGTDGQGRDVLSAVIYGVRISLFVGSASVLLSVVVGVAIGLLAGYSGSLLDGFLMRVADVQLSFPAILIALLIDGISRALIATELHDQIGIYVVVFAIGVTGWVGYARTVRALTQVEAKKEYVLAARLVGRHPLAIVLTHVLPNVAGPVVVLATLQIGAAIIAEATLSFLGVGVPPTQLSLGTQIRVGNDYVLSGEWWVIVFPGAALVIMVVTFNIVGDWLREALNPKLRR